LLYNSVEFKPLVKFFSPEHIALDCIQGRQYNNDIEILNRTATEAGNLVPCESQMFMS